MDARILRTVLILVSLISSTGAGFQTRNFTVTASTPEIAKQVGEAAETYRRDLAIFWLGQPLPNWSRPCVLRVKTGSLGAGGETKFQFVGNEVLNWNMYVQGSLERILDSVLPHEVNHTIFACHFRKPLPRWADEGAATLFEHRSEQAKQLGLLNQVIKNDRELISLDRLLTMKEYPSGYRPMLILYAQGYALADFLVQQGGQQKYLKFLHDGERMGWTQAIKANYAHDGIESLQKNWKGWILAGMPKLTDPREAMLAARDRIADNAIQGRSRPLILDEFPVKQTVRSQSPDDSSASSFKQTSNASGPTPAVQKTPASPIATPTTNRRRGSTGRPAASQPLPQRPDRSASFEAPRPANGKSTPVQAAAGQAAAGRADSNAWLVNNINASAMAAGSKSTNLATDRKQFESTAKSHLIDSEEARKHLPQKRKVVTGSIPQWAGFPGQSESF